MLEFHTRELPVKVPSSASEPESLKVIVSPSSYVLPFAGLVMVAVGEVFSYEVTVLLTESLPVAPSLSVAARVMVCVPTVRSSLVKEVPIPI